MDLKLTTEEKAIVQQLFAGDIDDIPYELYEKTFSYLLDNNEIPYGIAKARTGDPYEFVNNWLCEHFT